MNSRSGIAIVSLAVIASALASRAAIGGEETAGFPLEVRFICGGSPLDVEGWQVHGSAEGESVALRVEGHLRAGTLTLPSLASGRYVLRVRPRFPEGSSCREYFAEKSLDVEIEHRGPRTVEVSFPDRAVCGSVSDPRSEGWDGIEVILEGEDLPVGDGVRIRRWGARARTGGKGAFRLSPVPAGTYILALRSAGLGGDEPAGAAPLDPRAGLHPPLYRDGKPLWAVRVRDGLAGIVVPREGEVDLGVVAELREGDAPLSCSLRFGGTPAEGVTVTVESADDRDPAAIEYERLLLAREGYTRAGQRFTLETGSSGATPAIVVPAGLYVLSVPASIGARETVLVKTVRVEAGTEPAQAMFDAPTVEGFGEIRGQANGLPDLVEKWVKERPGVSVELRLRLAGGPLSFPSEGRYPASLSAALFVLLDEASLPAGVREASERVVRFEGLLPGSYELVPVVEVRAPRPRTGPYAEGAGILRSQGPQAYRAWLCENLPKLSESPEHESWIASCADLRRAFSKDFRLDPIPVEVERDRCAEVDLEKKVASR